MKKPLVIGLVATGILFASLVVGLLVFSNYLVNGDSSLSTHQLEVGKDRFNFLFPKNSIKDFNGKTVYSLAKDREQSLLIIDKVNYKRLRCSHFGAETAFTLNSDSLNIVCRVPCDSYGKGLVCYLTQIQTNKNKYRTVILFGKNVDADLDSVKRILSSVKTSM